jgi:hypothetical protein
VPKAYTQRVFAGGAGALERGTVGTVPGGLRWVIRNVTAFSAAGGELYVSNDPHGMLCLIHLDATAGRNFGSWEGRVVMDAGESLEVWSAPAGVITHITAYVFTV